MRHRGFQFVTLTEMAHHLEATHLCPTLNNLPVPRPNAALHLLQTLRAITRPGSLGQTGETLPGTATGETLAAPPSLALPEPAFPVFYDAGRRRWPWFVAPSRR